MGGMATIYKRGGAWYAQFKGLDGKRVTRPTGSSRKREASQIAADMEAEARRERTEATHLPKQFSAIIEAAAREAASGDLTLARAEELLHRLRSIANPDFREVNVGEWFREWIDAQAAHVAPSTLSGYNDAHRRMIAALGARTAAKPLSDLTAAEVRGGLAKIAKTVRASTANMDLRAFRRALEAATRDRLASVNVAKSVKPLPEDDSEERAPFTPEEVRKLIDTATDDETKGLILIAAHTGLRMGDVLRLGRANIQGKTLVIRPDKTKRQRKTITVPMTPPILGWIRKRKGEFFPSLSKKTKSTNSTNFGRLMKKAGVPRAVIIAGDVEAVRSFHSLRHSFTSWLAEADIHSDVRQKLTGHSSAGIHGTYTHFDESLARAVKQLPAL